jgi:hypothetical protein
MDFTRQELLHEIEKYEWKVSVSEVNCFELKF